MHKFTDSKGELWQLTIDLGSAMQIKKETGCDILDIAEGKDLIALSTDMEVLGATLWILCEGQAKSRGLEDKSFFERFNGAVMEEATEALVAECLDFFPPKKSALLRSAYERIRKAVDQQVEAANQKLSEISDEELQKLVTGYGSASTSEVDSVLTPEHSPVAN